MTRKIPSFFTLTLLMIASTPSFAATVAVNIQNFLFQPKGVTINLGDSVKWTNKDGAPHTATSDTALWDCKTACKTFQGPGEKSVEKFPPQVV